MSCPTRPDAGDPEVARRLVGYTWELSLDQLSADGLPRARTLLRLLALFNDAPIPRSVITPGLLIAVTAEPISTEAVDRTLTGLHRYGLIDVPDATRTHDVRTVTMHRLVREANAELLARSTDVAPWHEAVSRQLIRQVNGTAATGQAGWSTAHLLAPHLPLLTGLGSSQASAFIPARDAVNTLADQLKNAGDYASERRLREVCSTATEDHLGSEHPETLQCRDDLANALHSLGHYRQAVEVHETNLADRQRILDPEHPDTLHSQHNLASALQVLGQYQRAAHLFQRIVARRSLILGLNHPDTLRSRSGLAIALRSLGRYQRAAELDEQTLADRQRILGPDHPETLRSRSNLIAVLHVLGEFERADEVFKQGKSTQPE